MREEAITETKSRASWLERRINPTVWAHAYCVAVLGGLGYHHDCGVSDAKSVMIGCIQGALKCSR